MTLHLQSWCHTYVYVYVRYQQELVPATWDIVVVFVVENRAELKCPHDGTYSPMCGISFCQSKRQLWNQIEYEGLRSRRQLELGYLWIFAQLFETGLYFLRESFVIRRSFLTELLGYSYSFLLIACVISPSRFQRYLFYLRKEPVSKVGDKFIFFQLFDSILSALPKCPWAKPKESTQRNSEPFHGKLDDFRVEKGVRKWPLSSHETRNPGITLHLSCLKFSNHVRESRTRNTSPIKDTRDGWR